MRNSAIVLPGILAAILASSWVVLAQHAPPPPGWPLCPRCQGPQDRAEARAKFKSEGEPFGRMEENFPRIHRNRDALDTLLAIGRETRSLWSRTATTTGRGSLKTAGTADGVSLIVISCGSKRNTGESAMTPWRPR